MRTPNAAAREAAKPLGLIGRWLRRLATPASQVADVRPRSRVRAFADAHPTLVDASSFLVLLLAIGDIVDGHRLVEKLLVDVAMVVPLYWRRRHPSLVFAITATVAVVELAVHLEANCDVSLFIALFCVAAYDSRFRAVVALLLFQGGAVIASLEFDRGQFFSAYLGQSVAVIAAVTFGLWLSNRRTLLLFLEQRTTRLEQDRDREGRLAAAAERARIAREMHDVVAHNLTVMVALADGARYRIETDPTQSGAAIEAVSETGRRALTEMRRLLGVLGDDGVAERAPQPDLGQLASLVEEVRGAGLPVAFSTSGAAPSIPAGAQLALYRVVQEALTNTLKHAGPGATARVELHYTAEAVAVDVTNTGSRARTADRVDGRGLAGMEERAAAYGGTVDAGPAPGGRWRVHVTLPLEQAARS